MPLTDTRRAQLQIHLCVVLWGFTAILGKLITLPALPLVWWRMGLVTVALALLPRVWRGLRAMPPRLLGTYAGIGALVALHWLTFYGAIKLSNASVGATCMALATVFTALFEPLLTRTRLSWRQVAFGIAVLPGVALVVGGVPENMRAGIAVGTVSAVLVAVFASLNKRFVARADPLAVTWVELGAGALLLTVLAPLLAAWSPAFAGPPFVLPSSRDLGWLLVLALGCTVFPFSLALVALRHMSAFGAQMALNLEPVYAIVLAMLLLGEQRELTPRFYLGVGIVLLAVFAQPLLGTRREPAHAESLGTAEGRRVD
ncbi:MAG TPA: DMT family transporter [Xanthomonadaceae bacterium]|nr:DMT family transporter [Xanthomonadaceae bacterium]